MLSQNLFSRKNSVLLQYLRMKILKIIYLKITDLQNLECDCLINQHQRMFR